MAEARREFTLKNLRKALEAGARATAEMLASHGQPVLVLRDGKVVAHDANDDAQPSRPHRRAARA